MGYTVMMDLPEGFIDNKKSNKITYISDEHSIKDRCP